MNQRRRRLQAWLLAGLTVALVPGMIALDRAARFPAWRVAASWSPQAIPSTAAVPAKEVLSGHPTLSLVLDPADLYDPKRGILANVLEHGPDWEREGSVSYFDQGRLRFATGVGVRVHGGGSRITSERQGFRLYFRRRYGATQVPPGVLFEDDAQPIRRLVVHNDVRVDRDGTKWQFVNSLAYDIAEAVGAIGPDTKAVRFFLNGEFYGVFILTERIDERFFEAHWEHGRIRLDQTEFDRLWQWVSGTRPLTMAEVSEQVDLDNLTRWFLSVGFSATRDAYQGPGQLEDRTRDRAEWFWVNWDMDQSFRNWDLDMYQYLLERVGEEPKGRNRAEPRPTLLTNLIAEDAAYRVYYKRTFQHAMNHRLTPAFLEARYQHYVGLATSMGVKDWDFLPRLKDFLERRPGFFWRTTESWLNTEPAQTLAVSVPPGRTITEDGEPIAGEYRGLYFPDLDVTLEVPADDRRAFTGWYVDGRLAEAGPVLRLKVVRPTHVAPSFAGARLPAPGLPTFQPSSERHGGAAPALRWVRVPAGEESFEMLAQEVSAAQFSVFASVSGRRTPTQPDWFAKLDHPVMNVTWDEAQAFCSWAGGRLPSDAEWERAALGRLRAGAEPWGRGQANLQGQPAGDEWLYSAPSGSFRPNGFGLFDIWGNVWEWTADQSDQHTWPGYDMRLVRGGSWDNLPARIRAPVALSRLGRHNLYVGFRCVR